MLRTGLRDGFLPDEAGKNQAGTGARGFAVPGMQYDTLCVPSMSMCTLY
jgi:hypothetical protein